MSFATRLRCLGFAATLVAAPALAAPVSPALIAKASAAIDADSARLTAIFKDLHQHPEIAFTETRTAGIVARELKALGYAVTTGIGKTGVVGVLRNGPGPTLWFRADMDSNSVLEATGLPWAATTPQRLADGSEIPVMHACGHDAHVTWLLGLAKAMTTLKADWSGTLVVYAQPAEEIGMGAQAMVKDGLLTRGFPKPDLALGSHAVPLAVGVAVNAPGVRMAGTDQLDVTFTGVGGHGSSPELAIDPVVMAAQAVLAYQTIVSRSVDPQAPSVLTVGAVEAGRDNNVIPASAELRLNLRWFDRATRDRLLTRIDEINKGIVLGAGLPEAKVPVREMKGSAGPLRNDPTLVAAVTPALTTLLGDGKLLTDFPSVMGSEDFQEAFAGTDVPYTFLLIGIAEPARFAAAKAAGRPFPFANHNNDFAIDLPAIPLGAKIDTVAALALLAK
ncbi:amidohydrolase [Polymorphobacter fuscus]|uniref:Amidohydrolase n=1 Tax=Sandarakinorhabdus fusca TaxID=1439888 RepID=A0A7C9GUJ0_9SPHN|nr:amidohydrolase [Polymorphobacter fuscus]KAB7647509.1 amidohydrolase [Polymorphobacter fuscus]MQT16769.1 amidohydrolase [Polymorphobacter fuscus]NJC09243.1 hippurate hydrolase [Polymorphobacter fuscus]